MSIARTILSMLDEQGGNNPGIGNNPGNENIPSDVENIIGRFRRRG
jgi:hypothetical protein